MRRAVRLLQAPKKHRRGGGRRSHEWRELQSMRERFRRWAEIYWPEATRT